VVPGVRATVDNPSADQWFNKAAFVTQSTVFGTAGRDTIWGPGLQQWDFTFAKTLKLAEQRSLQFRGELFNALNNVAYNPPQMNASSGTFTRITSALPGRSIQFGLKLHW